MTRTESRTRSSKIGVQVLTSYRSLSRKKKGKAKDKQQTFEDWTADRIEENEAVNYIRTRVALWRDRDYPHITSVTRRLLEHWKNDDRYRRKHDGDDVKLTGDDRKEAEQREEEARIWISGLEAVNRKIGVKTVFDLSATPFFLRGSGYSEGTLFPWVVSDFSLIDAIESGIVKVPRVPVSDDSMIGDVPTYRDLWLRIRDDLPKKGRGQDAVTGEPRFGSTQWVRFDTVRPTYKTDPHKCHVSHVVADTDSREQKMAQTLEDMPEVIRYVKNHNLGFTIPYTINGQRKNYYADFIVHVDDGHGRDDPLQLIVEVTGAGDKKKEAKSSTAETLWVPAVNNAGQWGRWAYIEIRDPWDAEKTLRASVQAQEQAV